MELFFNMVKIIPIINCIVIIDNWIKVIYLPTALKVGSLGSKKIMPKNKHIASSTDTVVTAFLTFLNLAVSGIGDFDNFKYADMINSAVNSMKSWEKFEETFHYLLFSFAVLIDAISIRRMAPQSCKRLLDVSSDTIFAFKAISSQYSVS